MFEAAALIDLAHCESGLLMFISAVWNSLSNMPIQFVLNFRCHITLLILPSNTNYTHHWICFDEIFQEAYDLMREEGIGICKPRHTLVDVNEDTECGQNN